MVGSSNKLAFRKPLIVLISSLVLLFLFFSVQNKGGNNIPSKISHPISFKEVKEDLKSKYSLVLLDRDYKSIEVLVFATFDVFQEKEATVLHRNDFWNPESCSKMPSVFIRNNYLVTLDTKKIDSSFETRLFYFDKEKDKLFKSDPLKEIVGSLYKNNDDEIIFFSYEGKFLIKNIINLGTQERRSRVIYAFNGDKPQLSIVQVDDIFYIKFFYDELISLKKLKDDTLVEVLNIPDTDYWTVVNKNSEVFFYKRGITFSLPKENYEEYKLVKNSKNNLIFEVINKNNFDDYSLKLFRPKTKSLEIIYSNKNIPNSRYVISVN